MKILPDRKCVQCEKTFTPNRKWTIYCSTSCKMQHYYENKTSTIEKLEAEVLRLTELNTKLVADNLPEHKIIVSIPEKERVFKECDCCKKKVDINRPSTIKTSFVISGGNTSNKALFCNEACKIKYKSEHPTYQFKGK